LQYIPLSLLTSLSVSGSRSYASVIYPVIDVAVWLIWITQLIISLPPLEQSILFTHMLSSSLSLQRMLEGTSHAWVKQAAAISQERAWGSRKSTVNCVIRELPLMPLRAVAQPFAPPAAFPLPSSAIQTTRVQQQNEKPPTPSHRNPRLCNGHGHRPLIQPFLPKKVPTPGKQRAQLIYFPW